MKIHNDALVQAVWTLQLKMLSNRVLHRYVGERYGLVSNDWYKSSSSIHVCERHLITDKIGKQQIYKRVRELISQKYFSWSYQKLTFFIDTEQAKKAFNAARDFWLSKGVPEGMEGQRSLCVSLDNHQQLVDECFNHLQEQFKSVDFIELNDIVFATK